MRYILVNDRRLPLDEAAWDAGQIRGLNGASDRCEDCGRNLIQTARVLRPGWIICTSCAAPYLVVDEGDTC